MRYWKAGALALALVLGVGTLAACTPPPPIPGGAKMPTNLVDVPKIDDDGNASTLTGEPIYLPLSTCPSSRPDWMPPCTQAAGKSGAYAYAGYVCTAGQQGGYYWWKGVAYPSFRVCMDMQIVESPFILPKTTNNFYIQDLYQYWNVSQEVRDYVWHLAALYAAAFEYYGIAQGAVVCTLLVPAVTADPIGGIAVTAGCTLGFAIAVDYFLG